LFIDQTADSGSHRTGPLDEKKMQQFWLASNSFSVKKKNPAVMPCNNSSFELLFEQMEPSRSLTTSSQGLPATTEVRAPDGLIYGSRTLFLITNMAG
jgi:hypothetical protein